MCLGNTYELDLGFLGPEPGQTITVTSTNLPGWDYTITEGDDVTTITGIFTAQASNVGFQEIIMAGLAVALLVLALIILLGGDGDEYDSKNATYMPPTTEQDVLDAIIETGPDGDDGG